MALITIKVKRPDLTKFRGFFGRVLQASPIQFEVAGSEQAIEVDPNALSTCPKCDELVPTHGLHFCSAQDGLAHADGESSMTTIVSAGVRPYPE
jgi:hypothetical protein